MARSFNGSNTALFGNVVPLTTYPMTMAGWVKPSAGGTNAAWVLSLANGGNDYYVIAWRSNADASQGQARVNFNQTGVSSITAESSTADTTTGTWKHIAGTASVSGGNATLTAFLNGGGKNAATAATPTVTPINTGVGVIGLSTGNFGATTAVMADCAIWNVVLTDAEILALSLGHRPFRVRPQSLVGYWPIDGLQSPEPDLSGKVLNLPFINSPPFADGPPIALFTRRWPNNVLPSSAPPAPSAIFRRNASRIGTRTGTRQMWNA